MVELVRLPQMSGAADERVDLASEILTPRGPLRRDCRLMSERCQQVNVVRHDRERRDDIPLAVEFEQTIGDDLGGSAVPQMAGSEEFVECGIPSGKQLPAQ